jgi:hypothetical protein
VTQPGPHGAQFYRYPDQAAMDRVFAADLPPGLPELPADQDCTTTAGRTTWSTGDDRGQVACALSPAGQVVIAWTDEKALTEGVVIAPGTTQADLAALFEWWRSNSEYRS